MGATTGIAWCHATWNPWISCAFDSVECHNCFAKAWAERFRPEIKWGPHGDRVRTSPANWRLPLKLNAEAEKEGRRKQLFCGSLLDLFELLPVTHKDAQMQHDARAEVWGIIEATPWIDWQMLTKRPQNMPAMVPARWNDEGWPDNVWAMASVGNEQGKRRVHDLMRVNARVRGLSVEPMIEGFSLADELATGLIHWVIIGGESGPKARPFDLAWGQQIVDECSDARVAVAVFVKQLGAVPMMGMDSWRAMRPLPKEREALNDRTPFDCIPLWLDDQHGADWDQWPKGAIERVRQFPFDALPLHQKDATDEALGE